MIINLHRKCGTVALSRRKRKAEHNHETCHDMATYHQRDDVSHATTHRNATTYRRNNTTIQYYNNKSLTQRYRGGDVTFTRKRLNIN